MQILKMRSRNYSLTKSQFIKSQQTVGERASFSSVVQLLVRGLFFSNNLHLLQDTPIKSSGTGRQTDRHTHIHTHTHPRRGRRAHWEEERVQQECQGDQARVMEGARDQNILHTCIKLSNNKIFKDEKQLTNHTRDTQVHYSSKQVWEQELRPTYSPAAVY